jgi:hypothetical protein
MIPPIKLVSALQEYAERSDEFLADDLISLTSNSVRNAGYSSWISVSEGFIGLDRWKGKMKRYKGIMIGMWRLRHHRL